MIFRRLLALAAALAATAAVPASTVTLLTDFSSLGGHVRSIVEGDVPLNPLPDGWSASAGTGSVSVVTNPFPAATNPGVRVFRLAGVNPITLGDVGAFNTLLSPVINLSGYFTGSGASAVPKPGVDLTLSLYAASTANFGQRLAIGFADGGGTVYKWYAAHAPWGNVTFPVLGFGDNSAPAGAWWRATLANLAAALPAAGFNPSAVRLAFAHLDGSNPAHNFAEMHLGDITLTTAIAARGDRFLFPATATTDLPVLANDSGAAGLTITSANGHGFSIAPGGQALRYDATHPSAIAAALRNGENFAYATYAVNDGVVTTYAAIVLAPPMRGAVPPPPPDFPTAYYARTELIDPNNNTHDLAEQHDDAATQLRRIDLSFRNPNEFPLRIEVRFQPRSGRSFTRVHQPDGSTTQTSAVYNIPLTPGPFNGRAAFVGYQTVDGQRLERWVAPPPGGSEFVTDIYTGVRGTVAGTPVFFPREVISYNNALTQVRNVIHYREFIAYPGGHPDPSVFDETLP